jgi:hypothetical protein
MNTQDTTWYATFLSPEVSGLLGGLVSADVLAADPVIVDRVYSHAGSRRGSREYYAEWFMRKYRRAAAGTAALPDSTPPK